MGGVMSVCHYILTLQLAAVADIFMLDIAGS